MPPQEKEVELDDAPPTGTSMSRSKSLAVFPLPPSSPIPHVLRRTESLPGFGNTAPELGGYVWTLYGRALVQELRAQHVKVELLDWKLANHRSRVTCILKYDDVTLLATQTLSTMSISERLEYANELKANASNEQTAKRYINACNLYQEAIAIVTAVLQDPANPEERADCLLLTVKCCNNAAYCALQVDRFAQALEWTKNSMVVLDALERKTPDNSNSNSLALVGKIKLFGECRIKALLYMAEALVGMHEKHAAKRLLQQAQDVVQQYTAPEYLQQPEFKPFVKRFLAHQRAIKTLKKKCRERPPVPVAEPVAETSWLRTRKVWFSDEDRRASKNEESDDDVPNLWTRHKSAVVYGAMFMGSLVLVGLVVVRRSRRT